MYQIIFSGMAELIEREAEKLEQNEAEAKAGRGTGKGRRGKKRGPKGPQYDPKRDKQVFDVWKASGYPTIEEYARKEQGAETQKDIRRIRRAIDRERKRRSRKGLK